MKTVLLALLFGLQLFAGEMLERTQMLMGTYATLSLPRENAEAMQQAFTVIRAVEASLSSYDARADIYRLNHDREANLTAYTYEALLLCRRYYEVSGGYFDITVGSVTKGLYRFGEVQRLPAAAELKSAKIDFKGLRFDAKSAEVAPGITVDLGGMGKGFGVDKAAAYLKEHNVTEGRVALSGDIRCLGRCEIAVQDPFSDALIATFTTRYPDMAVSTSGNYRRYVVTPENNHLIDPKTGMPERGFASVTLLSRGSNSDIDAYATAASVMPVDEALRFLKGLDVAYLLVTSGGKRYISDNFDRFAAHFTYLK